MNGLGKVYFHLITHSICLRYTVMTLPAESKVSMVSYMFITAVKRAAILLTPAAYFHSLLDDLAEIS